MDEALPDNEAITVPVLLAEVTAEERSRTFPVADITHFVVQRSDRRLDLIMQSVAGIPYSFNKPWPFWFFICKIVSKALFDDENQLKWLNAVRVRDREFIAFTNTQSNVEEAKLQVVEIDLPKPQPGEPLKLFGRPAREIICPKVQDCE
ncbi:hypothetical protein BDV37DRAFT_285210 [Aspergillus pseudonomiae]|uniref:Uncharacterized protein n=1 Tax=Aspergillus pseudonomiae TaxID=1506151 RepID=A0A5N7D6B7_9EURO|nr:uncharacterized protein BDV37DRAFT_285210 [Aspergillus pseudonomiae]KAE8401950.1 hypothetical protein BDV37DRAFT_285210 [Aspergillus pseudonomiae]